MEKNKFSYFFQEYKNITQPGMGKHALNMNIYRGCTHGCIYCDARSKCYQINHDFEYIEVKKDAPKLLDIELSKRKHPCMVGTGSMSDPYNHIEEEIRYTRQCLEVIYKHHCGVTILTKSNRILQDIDLIDKINKDSKAVVQMTLTTADDELCKIIEPNVCVTSERVKVLKECQKRGIPTVVWLCPFLPFINDTYENISKLMDYIVDAGVKGIVFFGIGVTLREGDREYFYKNLDKHFRGMKFKYMKYYGNKYNVVSFNEKELSHFVIETCKRNDIMYDCNQVFKYMAEYPITYGQMSLFDL